MDYHFQAEKLTVGYDKQPVVENIEVRLKKGQVLALIGPNGSGKSTVLKSIAKQGTHEVSMRMQIRPDSIPFVYDVKEDSYNNLWVASYSQGVIKYNYTTAQWTFYSRKVHAHTAGWRRVADS